jgi:hypothetical protein
MKEKIIPYPQNLETFDLQDMGFEFLHEERNVRSNYDQNPRNMLKYTYDSVFFVSQKL